jgi:CheY-like chemotaxis protein
MAASFYLCWVDDISGFPSTLKGHIELLELDHDVKFIIDEHTSTNDLDTIVRNFEDDVICFVDYNLKDGNGNGLDGHEVIAQIRQHNTNCRIVFYSSKATQEELQQLINGQTGVICVLREDLRNILTDIATGDL